MALAPTFPTYRACTTYLPTYSSIFLAFVLDATRAQNTSHLSLAFDLEWRIPSADVRAQRGYFVFLIEASASQVIY